MSTIPAGYKQTEIGVFPEEWEVKRIRELDLDISDGNYSSKYPRASEFVQFGVPFIRANNIKSSTVIDDDMRFISPEKHCELKKGHLKRDDLLITTRGEIGQIAIVPERHIDSNINAQIVRIGTRAHCSRFFNFIFQFKASKEQFSNLQTGSALKQLPVGRLLQLIIPLPPLAEQKRIAQVLGDVDALIQKLEALIAKKRDIKQASMQELLTGKRRLPGFSGAWETKRLGEIGQVVTGSTPKTDVPAYWGEGFPWITPTDINQKRDMVSSERTVTRKGLQVIRELPANTVLVTCIASIGKNAILRAKGACNQQINAIIPSTSYSPEFLYYTIENSKSYLQSNAGTTATSIISKTTFFELVFIFPPLPEQAAIAQVLSDMDAELEKLEARLAKTRDLKAGLMGELLTGRIRLRVAN